MDFIGSIIGVVQTHNADIMTKRALLDVQKDYMPIIELVDKVRCDDKMVIPLILIMEWDCKKSSFGDIVPY